MENPRPEKVAVVAEVRQRFEEADAALLTEYRGLNVKALADLRRQLRPVGGEYKVYKNTLVRFAAREAGAEGIESLLTGPTAITFVKGDAAAAAKTLRDYAKTNPTLVVKGGLLGTKVLSAADVTVLADLPPRDVVLARLAGALQAPLAKMAGLLQALPRNFAYGLKALIDDRSAGEPVAATEISGAESTASDAGEPVAATEISGAESTATEISGAESTATEISGAESTATEISGAEGTASDAGEPAAAAEPAADTATEE